MPRRVAVIALFEFVSGKHGEEVRLVYEARDPSVAQIGRKNELWATSFGFRFRATHSSGLYLS